MIRPVVTQLSYRVCRSRHDSSGRDTTQLQGVEIAP